MKIAVILHNGIECNSALHVRSLLATMSYDSSELVIAVPDDTSNSRTLPACAQILTHKALRITAESGDWLPDLVVAWTPRENVRLTALAVAAAADCPYVVHLEDNEDVITARHMGIKLDRLRFTLPWKFRHLNGLPISCPWRSRWFLRGAAGVSVLIDRLQECVPRGIPVLTIWPGYDESLFGMACPAKQQNSNRSDQARIVYTGNIHRGNVHDMCDLYETIALLNAEGNHVRLVRTGETHVEGFEQMVTQSLPYVEELGFVERAALPKLVESATVLVQPGRPGVFNDYRFPSKLPEFLVSGRPVVMARCNLGRFLEDGHEALLVESGTPGELANAVRKLLSRPGLAEQIGRGGKAFAEKNLRWVKASQKLQSFWEKVTL